MEDFIIRYKIKNIRLKHGMTLRELEKLSSVSRSELSNVERNKADPTLRTLIMIARGLNIDVTELFEVITR